MGVALAMAEETTEETTEDTADIVMVVSVLNVSEKEKRLCGLPSVDAR